MAVSGVWWPTSWPRRESGDWSSHTPAPCTTPGEVQQYIIDARPAALLDAPDPEGPPRVLQLSPPSPNPSRDGMVVRFTLPSGRPTALEVFDVSGRRVAVHNVGVLGAGQHVVDLDAERRLPTGVYMVTLTDGHDLRSTKAVILR